MDSSGGDFYWWLSEQARQAGWDIDGPIPLEVSVEGERSQANGRMVLRIWAAVAATQGLTEEQTTQLARRLNVTPQEVTDAYRPEMRHAAMKTLLGQPDLAALDAELDRIAELPST
jgi:hypothetical protein